MAHPRFHGLYTPKLRTLEYLRKGLAGGSHLTDYYAPGFFADREMVRQFVALFTLCRRLSEIGFSPEEMEHKLLSDRDVQKLIFGLALSKARVMNHYALVKKLPRVIIENKPAEAYFDDAKSFLLELQGQHTVTMKFFRRFFHFNDEEADIYEHFVAHSVKALYAMGYPDAAYHSSQVSRLCVVKAADANACRPEMLQAALVGWLHDPKFETTLSIDNLSTHPIIGSAIAWHILNEPELRGKISRYVTGTGFGPRTFAAGVSEALSVNNDSRFVSERFIFDQIALQIVRQYGEERGRLLREKLWDRHQQRLAAPSRGEEPLPFPPSLVEAISKTRLDSGMLGIRKASWEEACEAVSIPAPVDEAYHKIVDGLYPDRRQMEQVSDYLLEKQVMTKEVACEWGVNGLHLFSHHDEVARYGQVAALALVNADPLLLSPHKVLEVRPEKEVLLDRLKSYIGSLDSNINDLPKASRESALAWQRAIFICLLKGAQDLTGVDRLTEFHQNHRYTPTQTDVDELRRRILEVETWREHTKLAATAEERSKFDLVLDTLRRRYLEMCEYYREVAMSSDINEAKIT